MMYFKFKDYEEFKTIFPVREMNNGLTTRSNKILLACIKNKTFFKECIVKDFHGYRCNTSSITTFKEWLYSVLKYNSYDYHVVNMFTLKNGILLPQSEIANDEMEGVCMDGDCRCVRFRRNGALHKMKAGKFFRLAVESSWLNGILPEQACRYFEEEFATTWSAYCSELHTDMELHVGSERGDFATIYNRSLYVGGFSSCMAGTGQSDFYYDAVTAKAAWLTNSDGLIVARCVIFTEVSDEDGNTYRLAERQYSSEQDDSLKQLLVNKLISAGEIDGYKKVGVDCHNARAYVSNSGEDWSDKHFSIRCFLDYGDVMSYQDSFKWYNKGENIAYNTSYYSYDAELCRTDHYFEREGNYSEYNDEYIPEDEAYYDPWRDDYFWQNQVVYINRENEYCFEDDAYFCEQCHSYFRPEDDCYHSSITGENYCCSDCRDEAEEQYKRDYWYWSDYDEGYYEDDCAVTSFYRWNGRRFYEETVSVESLESLDAIEVYGDFYYGNDEEALKLKAELEIA